MKIINSIEKVSLKKPVVLTIGNFDGVHLGHQTVLKRVIELADQESCRSVVITFSNHPSEILRPEQPVQSLCTSIHKVRLLEQMKINTLLLLTFTKEFSQQNAGTFLELISEHMSISHLILGYDATIGKGKEGDRNLLPLIAKKLNFHLEYLSPYILENGPVSSSAIRTCIRQGNLEQAAKMLGRPYAICGSVVEDSGLGRQMDYPTAHLIVDGLCLPPLGVYVVTVLKEGNEFLGIANLGQALMVKDNSSMLLEVMLFNGHEIAPNEIVEVVFGHYLRPEKKFSSLAALQEQIALDIAHAKQELGLTL